MEREKHRERWRRKTECVCVRVCVCILYVRAKGGRLRRGREGWRVKEKEILTDFAVGIGGFSTGTEVRIPPQQVYSLLLQT